MAMRWRCPPESRMPRSPTTVRYPWGRAAMNSWAFAARAAASSSAAEASGLPMRRLSSTVPWKR